MAALTITAGSVLAASDAVTVTGTSGATITAGKAVYLDANNVYQMSLATSLVAAQCDGIALNAASSGQPLRVCASGSINLGATLTVGTSYYVSDQAAGAIIPFSDLGTGDYPTFLGVASTSALMVLEIQEGGVAKA